MPSFFQNLFKKDSDDPVVADDQEADATELNSLKSVMNLPSPFVVSAEEQFTVRELIMLIPQQFVRHDAMPGDQVVSLPLEALRASLQQGRPALRLSQIHVACPFLFSRQVLPAEDVDIVLPFQKVKRMVESLPGSGNIAAASPFAAVVPSHQPGAGRGDSPFAPQANPFASNASPPPALTASPFSVQRAAHDPTFAVRSGDQAGDAEVLSPGSAGQMPSLETATAVNPFQRLDPPAAVPPRATQSPFQLVSPAAAPPSVEAAPPSPAFPPSPSAQASPFAHAAGKGNGNGHAAPKVEEFPDIDAPPGSGADSEPSARHDAAPLEPPPAAAPPPAPAPAVALPVRPQPLTDQPVLPSLIAPPAGTAQEQPKRLRVSLASLLRDVTADDLGFDPTSVPGNVDAELFYDTILPQLATGRVEVSIEELRAGVVDRFRPAFARVKPGLRFVVPLSEIFQNLPSGAIPAPQSAEHVAINTTPFVTPFAIKAGEDEARASLPSLSQMITPAAPEPAPLAPFPVAPPIASPKLQSSPVTLPPLLTQPVPVTPPAPSSAEPVTPKLPGMPKLPTIPGMSGRPSPFSRPPGVQPPVPVAVEPPVLPAVAPRSAMPSLPAAESHEDLGHPFSASSLRNEPPGSAPAPPPVEPFDPSKLFTEPSPVTPPAPGAAAATKPEAAPAAVASVRPRPAAVPPPAPVVMAAPPVEFNFGETVDYNQTLLRAFFAADGDLTPHQIVDHCAQLPGLRSCLAIVAGKVISSGHDSGSEDVAHFTANAPRAFEYLNGLAGSMNCEGNGSITLRAGATVRTFFMESGICLAVLHESSGFAGGVREKLILTARALADLMD